MPKSRKPNRKSKPKKTRFFGKQTTGKEREQFLGEKQKAMQHLKHFLGLTSGIHAIYPPVRNVVVKLNRIPFAYTTESSSPIIETPLEIKEIKAITKSILQKDLTVAQAKLKISAIAKRHLQKGTLPKNLTVAQATKHPVVSFTSAYVDFKIDSSVPQAKEFIASLLNWQKRNFPTAFVNATALGNKVLKILLNAPLGRRKFSNAKVPGKQAKELNLESENFMKALEAFLDNYSKTKT